jgi:outer membrane usher protein
LAGALLLAWSLEASAELDPFVAEVTVNGLPDGVSVFMRDEAGALHASGETLTRWRLVAARPEPLVADGVAWYALTAFPGVQTRLDHSALTLEVRIPPMLLPETRLGGVPAAPTPLPPDVGAFLDYQWGYSAPAGAHTPDLMSLALDPTVFGPAGNLTSGLVWRQTRGGAPGSGADDGWLRLDTTWTTDDPAKLRSFRVGDSLTIGATWQRALRFGGLQLARNFSTQPRMSTVPQPAVRGTAVLPTTVEVLIDGQTRSAAELPPGSWALDHIPVTTGAGELTVVTTDLAGRRQEQVIDFYASPRQLRPGLTDFGISIGWAREDYGLESFDYGDAFACLTYRRGQTDRLTWETAAELGERFATAGLGGSYSWPRVGLASIAFAGSRDREGRIGTLWQAGFERRARGISVSAGLQGASRDFRQLGYAPEDDAPRRQGIASLGLGLGDLGSLAMTVARQEPFDGEERTFMQVGLTRTMHSGLSVSAFWRHTDAEDSGSFVGLNVNWRVGQRDSAGASMAVDDDQWNASAEYRRDLPLGEGLGYRVRSTAGTSRGSEATFNMNTPTMRWDADVRRSTSGTEWAVFGGGSLVWLGSLHGTRQVRDSFAVVDTGGMPGVRVYWENQEIGRTDDAGRLLVPLLRPFDANKLSINVTDLPIAASVERSSVRAVPYDRSGMVVNFGVRSRRPAILRLVRQDGTVVPAGAVAHRPGVEAAWPVGYDGRLYLPDTTGVGEIHVRWHGQECTVMLPTRGGAGPVPDLGEATCEVQP